MASQVTEFHREAVIRRFLVVSHSPVEVCRHQDITHAKLGLPLESTLNARYFADFLGDTD